MNSRPDLKPYQLQYLIAVAEQGSLRQAAQSVGVSPAAVSKGLKELEDTVHVALFERHASGYVLSAAGRMLLARARSITAEMNAAMQELRNAASGTITPLSVGITPWIMYTVLPAVLAEFHQQRPDVRLRIHETLGTDYAALRAGNVDLAIGLSPAAETAPDLAIRPLFSYEQAVACRVDHPCANVSSMDRLAGQGWILSHNIDQYGTPFREYFQTHFGADFPGVPSAQLCFTRSSVAALHVVENTDMLSILPWPLVEAMRYRYRITAVPLREQVEERKTSFITRRNTPCNGAIGAFVEALMKVVDEAAARRDDSWIRIARAVDLVRR